MIQVAFDRAQYKIPISYNTICHAAGSGLCLHVDNTHSISLFLTLGLAIKVLKILNAFKFTPCIFFLFLKKKMTKIKQNFEVFGVKSI